MNTYDPLTIVSSGLSFHSALIGSGFRIRLKNYTNAARPVGTFGLCWM